MNNSEWREKYMREVEGLNNEGDPIGGDPPSGLRAAYKALQKEKDKIEDELDQYKEHHEELTEHYKALQFLESEFRKENAAHLMKISDLENELVEWNEFKKIRDDRLRDLGKKMS